MRLRARRFATRENIFSRKKSGRNRPIVIQPAATQFTGTPGILFSFLFSRAIIINRRQCARARARAAILPSRFSRFSSADSADLAVLFKDPASDSRPNGLMKRNRSITYYRTDLERVGRALNFRPDVHRSAARLLFAVGIRDDRDMP